MYLILKNILTTYQWNYRRNKFISIFQKVRKDLLEMPITLFNHQRVHCVDNLDINHWWNYKQPFCQWYSIVTNGNTERLIPEFFFVWRAYSIYKSISNYIIDGMTNKIGIIEEIFLDEL